MSGMNKFFFHNELTRDLGCDRRRSALTQTGPTHSCHEIVMRRARDRQSGFALMLVLMLIVFGTIYGMTYLSVASVKAASSANLALSARSRYLAEAGLEHALHVLRVSPASLTGSVAAPLGPYKVDATGDSYTFWGQATGLPNEYKLTGRGVAGSMARELSLTARTNNEFYSKMMEYDPASYWRMDDASGVVCADVKGEYNGTYMNGVTLGAEGVLDSSQSPSAQFDGNNDYVDLDAMDVDGSVLTLVAWVLIEADPGGNPNGYILSKSTGPAIKNHYWSLSSYSKFSERYLRFNLKTGATVTELSATSGELAAGTWYLCAAVYDGSRMKIYLDGKIVASTPKTGTIPIDGTVDAWMSGNPDNASVRPWDGLLDEVAVLDKALSQEQLQALYETQMATVEIVEWNE